MSDAAADFKQLYPFRSHYIDLQGLKYHYIDEGSGEPVVMVHGNPTWSFYFRQLGRSLSTHYRVIIPDHIGCGFSDKPAAWRYAYSLQDRVDDLDRLISSLQLSQKTTLILHDWGGMIGMAYALRHPQTIGRLVMMNTFAFLPPTQKRIPWTAFFIRKFGPLSAFAVCGLNLFATGALLLAARKKLSKAVRKAYTAPYNNWKNRIAILKFVQDIPLSPNDASYPLARFVDDNLHIFTDLPLLICWGERDFVFDQTFLDEWQRRFPEAAVHRYPDAGHYVLEDAAADIIPRIQEFLKKHAL